MQTINTTSIRQHQRIRFFFPLRYRPYGTVDPWQEGIGIDLSIGGLACMIPVSSRPSVGAIYELELVLHFPDCSQEQVYIQAEVRWSTTVPGGSKLGLQVFDSSSRARLARALLPL